MRELIGLHYSPWTERALWALDHHGLPYRYHEHLIIFEMPVLRWKLRRFCGSVTVPAMIDPMYRKTLRFFDSWDIARHADRLGGAPKLFPKEHVDEIRSFNDLSERALSASRALLIDRMQHNPEALKALLPSFIPNVLRSPLLFVAKTGLRYVAREFSVRSQSTREHESELREVLMSLRESLASAKSDYLLGNFSYADVTMAVALQFADPVADEFKKIDPDFRRCCRQEQLAGEFRDLIQWRDRLYATHRKKRP